MVRFVFGVEDVTRIRFALSPMWELFASLVALRDPASASPHLPWVEEVRPRLAGLDLGAALTLAVPRGYMVDFLTPPPTTPVAEFAEELAQVRATPVAQVRHELEIFRRRHGSSPALDAVAATPQRGLQQLADAIEAYWERCVAPWWPRLRALIRADLALRARRLTEGGHEGLFSDLHHQIAWRDGGVDVHLDWDARVELGGRGLVLVPSAFMWAKTMIVSDEPWQPTAIYPARGLALLWRQGDAAPDGLARVLGATRAAVLGALDAPRSTTDLAALLGVSAGGASQHLTALRDAGLVTGTREGRTVLYARTPVADALVTGGD